MTRRLLLLSLVAFGLAPRRATAANGSTDLLKCRLELIELRNRLGESHPRLRAIQQRISGLEAIGARIDPIQAEQEFTRLFARRSELRQTFGLDHPKVITTTGQIGYLATVLIDRPATSRKPASDRFGTLAGSTQP